MKKWTLNRVNKAIEDAYNSDIPNVIVIQTLKLIKNEIILQEQNKR